LEQKTSVPSLIQAVGFAVENASKTLLARAKKTVIAKAPRMSHRNAGFTADAAPACSVRASGRRFQLNQEVST